MGALLDVLGALMVGTILLLMILSFQMQLRETADRTIYAAHMMTHVQTACKELNSIIALCGVNLPMDSVVVIIADSTKMAFRTYWDYKNNVMTQDANTLSFKLKDSATYVGRELEIIQSASPIYDLGAIFWLDQLKFYYYDINGNFLGNVVTGNTRKDIFSLDIGMTFSRQYPYIASPPLKTKVQLKCYLMNRFLRYSN
ncbi:MAG: hypothetical protein FJ041_01210 [Candidatus Cloacimonetes bacterium]|nr:hypothetical protein [Candidatus Cloacimonadota bacterium]